MAKTDRSKAIGRRVKAALALADRPRAKDELASELGYKGTRTIDRIISGEHHVTEEQFETIAAVLEVPEWFLRDGLTTKPPAAERRLDEALLALPDQISAAVAKAFRTQEVRQELRAAVQESARADTAARRRQLERDEPS